MFEPHQFERDVPLKNQRENSMYTIKNAKIEDITCDGNSAYLKTRTNKRYYCLLVKDGRVITKIVHSFDDENFYLNQRNDRDYEAIRVDINDVYLIERYYRQNKSIPLLRQMIVRIKAVKTDFMKTIAVLFILNRKMKKLEKLSLCSLMETRNFLSNLILGHLFMN